MVDVRFMINPAVVTCGSDAVVVVDLSFLQLPAKSENNRKYADRTVLRKEGNFMRNIIKVVKFNSCSLRYVF